MIPISTTLSFSNSDLDFIIYKSGNYQYICEAAPGTPTSDTGWRIKRVETDIDGDAIRGIWANGDNGFNYIADEYAAQTY